MATAGCNSGCILKCFKWNVLFCVICVGQTSHECHRKPSEWHSPPIKPKITFPIDLLNVVKSEQRNRSTLLSQYSLVNKISCISRKKLLFGAYSLFVPTLLPPNTWLDLFPLHLTWFNWFGFMLYVCLCSVQAGRAFFFYMWLVWTWLW